MKKLILTMGLVAAVTAVYAQGTINFQNSFLTPISLRIQNTDGTYTTPVAVPTTAGLVDYGVFYGSASGSLSLVPVTTSTPLFANSTGAAGVVAAPTTAFAIPGSNPGDTTWFVQVRGWSASYGTDWSTAQTDFNNGVAKTIWGTSAIASGFALGPAAGPGYAIWQAASGTSTAKIGAFVLTQAAGVPEPSTMALAGLGLAGMLIFRRRK
jgi:hypothetical protein